MVSISIKLIFLAVQDVLMTF